MQLFFELIQVSIGNRDMLSRVPTEEEWDALFKAAHKQAIAGIAFMGISRYVEIAHKEQVQSSKFKVQSEEYEEEFDESWLEAVNLPEELYYTWMQQAMDIQKRNRLMDKQCVELQERLKKDGFNSCILKGQGVARLYKYDNPNDNLNDNDNIELGTLNFDLASLRQSGDIDIWIEGDIIQLISYINSISPTKDIRDNHIKFNIFDDAEVEAHFRPASIWNPIKNRRLQQFFESQAESVYFNNVNNNTERKNTFTTPTIEFNLVHLLVHIYHHLMTEGVGLRQVMDYYFCLLAISKNNDNANDNEKALATIKELGLERFASALMWVIANVFTNENEGKQLSLETKTEKTPIDSFDSVNLNDEVCISQNIHEFSPCENQSPSTSLAVENESIGNKQEINNANDNLNDNNINDNLNPDLNNLNDNKGWMLWEPNEEDGRFLLEEIMKSGNFGKQDERQKNLYKNKWNSFWTVHFKTFRFWRFDHWAWFWSPLCRIYGYFKRKSKGYN